MFLTKEELHELTGYVYHCRQIDWLRRHNWKFEVTAQQRPHSQQDKKDHLAPRLSHLQQTLVF